MKSLRWFLPFGLFFLLVAAVLWLWLEPPRFWLNWTQAVDLSNPARSGEQLVEKYECRACHIIAGAGQPFGPALDGVTDRLDAVSLRIWLRDPAAVKLDAAMHAIRLSDSEVEAIAAFLTENDRGNQR